jgi:methionyl-tRNA formyltransferase
VNGAGRTDGPARTIFVGSGSFGLPALTALADHPRVELAAVVTAPPRPAGRGQAIRPTPIAIQAEHLRIPTLTPRRLRDADALANVLLLAPDLLVLADYGQLVPVALLEEPRHGALNLHPSLLPRHRGAAPIPGAIVAGDDETGVSLMLMDEGLDSGPLLVQRRVVLEGSETAPELEARLAAMAAELLAESLAPWLDGELVPTAQAESGVTMTRPLRREDGRLDPALPAVELERRVRAFQPWPGSFVDTVAGRLVVWRARPLPATPPGIGQVIRSPDGGLALGTADGLLELLDVQPAGGQLMSGAELLRGRPALAGSAVTPVS